MLFLTKIILQFEKNTCTVVEKLVLKILFSGIFYSKVGPKKIINQTQILCQNMLHNLPLQLREE